jgi:hypothetical protein
MRRSPASTLRTRSTENVSANQALHLVGDGLRIRIRDVERELDLVVVLETRGLDELKFVCAVGRHIGFSDQ